MTNDALRLLSALGEGEDNAMTRGALCALLGLPDRTVRKLIEEARRDETEDGPFIVNACEGKGYFLARNADEIERHYRAARRQALERAAESKKKYLDSVLNGEKFSTPRCSISYRKTTGVEVSDMGAVVAWMLANGHDDEVTYNAPTVSKTDLATLLKSGAEIDGATLVQGMSMGVK